MCCCLVSCLAATHLHTTYICHEQPAVSFPLQSDKVTVLRMLSRLSFVRLSPGEAEKSRRSDLNTQQSEHLSEIHIPRRQQQPQSARTCLSAAAWHAIITACERRERSRILPATMPAMLPGHVGAIASRVSSSDSRRSSEQFCKWPGSPKPALLACVFAPRLALSGSG